MTHRTYAWLAALIVWGIYLLEFQVPIVLAFAATVSTFVVLLAYRGHMDTLGLVTLLNFAYWITSGLMVGSITPLDFLSVEFADGEGRIFITYAPMLLFSVAVVRESNLWSLHRLLFIVGIVSMVLYVIWARTTSPILSVGPQNHFAAFFTSHNGSGGFFGVLAVFLILYGRESQRTPTTILGFLMVLPMIGTGSREAGVAFMATFVWYLIKTRHWRVMAIGAVAALIVSIFMPILAPGVWGRYTILFEWDLILRILDTIQNSDWKPRPPETADISVLGSDANIISRIIFWTYSVKQFFLSPIFGIGWGRWNDFELQMLGLPHLFYVAAGGIPVHLVSHAHNSYFHILAESGLFGLALFSWLWVGAYVRFQYASKRFATLKDVRAISITCQGVIVYAAFAALTDHAFAAPSLGLLLTTIVGLSLAYLRSLDLAVRVGPVPPPLGKQAVAV